MRRNHRSEGTTTTRRPSPVKVPRPTLHALLVAGTLMVGTSACDNDALPWATQDAGTVDARAQLPPVEVSLPAVPNLDLVDVPATYDDGSYSVSGLLLNRAELRDMPIRLTGTLHSIYRCETEDEGVAGAVADLADPGTEQGEFEVRPGCLRPHFHLVDGLRSPQRMLVTGYDAAHYEPQLTPGRRIVVEGTYAQQTRGFISTEDGLVVTTLITGEGIEQPVEETDEAQ